MNKNNQHNQNPRNDIESRKRGPFSVFVLSYELPPTPTEFSGRHGKHQFITETHRERKAAAREWHRNPNRRRSVPVNVLV